MASSFRNSLLPMISRVRALPGQMGLRPYSVALITGTWNGTNTGRGALAQDVVPVTEANGQPPKVRVMNTEELALAGLGKGSMKIGPITPPFAGGGSPLIAARAALQAGQTMHVMLTGPDMPEGNLFLIKSWNADRALHETLVVSPVAEQVFP